MTAIYLSAVTQYLNTKPAQAGTVANRIAARAALPYRVETDFWKRARAALLADRRTTRDGQALHAAAQNTPDQKKMPLFAAAARRWEQVAPRWARCEHVPLPTASVTIGGLEVKIPAGFAERHPDGGLEVVIVRFNEDKLSDDVVDAVLRLVQRRYPTCTITFVDLPRLTIRTTRGRNLENYDAWLDQAGMYLAYVMDQAA